jgi:hypothetical protein
LVDVEVGNAGFVDASQVCCFYLAPRSRSTGIPFETLTGAIDDPYADRILNIPPLSTNVFPRTLDTPYNLCGKPYAVLLSKNQLECSAPALPEHLDNTFVWTLRVTVNGQNHHGFLNILAQFNGLDGPQYSSMPCQAGFYTATYDQACSPCAAGSYDPRNEFSFNQLRVCQVCNLPHVVTTRQQICLAVVRLYFFVVHVHVLFLSFSLF